MSTEPQRESMAYDVVIVGAGPAGLSAAIHLKQLAAARTREVSVCIIEKGSEVGAHILSGAVLDPSALSELIPDWKDKGAPVETPVSDDRFYLFSRRAAIRIPSILLPPLMHNRGNFVISLSNLCRWLGAQAEALGVEIYPGFPAHDVIIEDNVVKGVITGDLGVAKDGHRKPNYQPGMELRGKYVLFAEGARGSLSKIVTQHFALQADRAPQKFGIGLKELWELAPGKHRKGLVVHSLGWPLANDTSGGLFMYHWGDNYCAIGFVVHLNYTNPYLDPFCEFQRVKTHPYVRQFLEGGKRVGYGARALTEGGYQSVPKLAFPGGALIGCAAGFVNVPRIKGIHNAMRTGMMAAEAVLGALAEGRANDTLESYEQAYKSSAVARELRRIRNIKPLWSKLGTLLALPFMGLDMWTNQLFGISVFGTLTHTKPDFATLKKTKDAKPVTYPKPDGKLTFDRPSSVFLSNTSHEEDQPVHLVLRDPNLPIAVNLPQYAEPAQRYCPAGVYEVIEATPLPTGRPATRSVRFQINASNCVHCKTCDIKDPSQNIMWTTPEGGGGPNYSNM